MELSQSEYNTLIYALKVAIETQKKLASQHNNPTFIREDFNQLLIKVEKWQRKLKRNSNKQLT